ncbi:MAG: hypothetical protein ACFCU8_07520 [Thermosynechococcaceae cyanobacterium]
MDTYRCDITPETSAVHPSVLQMGQTLTIELTVENQADDVDRFQLVCAGLPERYYTIIYPDVQVWTGLVVKFNSLELEPGQTGTIQVQVHPPANALVRAEQLLLTLHSQLDTEHHQAIYLQIEPACDLFMALTPASQSVMGRTGHYQLLLKNDGPVPRNLVVQARSLSGRSAVTYQIEPSNVRLDPETEVSVALAVQRTHKRFQIGQPRQIQFEVGLEDQDGLPLPSQFPQGVTTWQRSRKVPRLLLPLALGAAVAAALGWVLWSQQSSLQPEITALQATTDPEAREQESVRLNWVIKNPQQLQTLSLVRQGSTGAQIIKTFDFSKGIPSELQEPNAKQGFCQFETQAKPQALVCKNILAALPNAQLYQFRLQSFSPASATRPTDSKLTDAIALTPNPTPKIVAFFSPNTQYASQEKTVGVLQVKTPSSSKQSTGAATEKKGNNTGILLDWEITHPRQIKELQLRQSNGQLQTYPLIAGQVPKDLQPYCKVKQSLVCKGVPTNIQDPGRYMFKLVVQPQGRLTAAALPQTTGPIEVKPQPLQVASFRINGQPVTDKYIYDVAKLGQKPKLNLEWTVKGGNEVRAAIYPVPGVVPATGKTTINLNPSYQKGVLLLQAVDANGQQLKRTVAIELRQPTTAAQQPTPAKQTSPPKPIAARPAPISPRSPISRPPAPKRTAPAKKPVVATRTKTNVPQGDAIQPWDTSSVSGQSLSEANAIMRGLVVARNAGKIVPDGPTWRKTQDAVRLLRRGYSRSEAAQRSGVPLSKLDTLVAIGSR